MRKPSAPIRDSRITVWRREPKHRRVALLLEKQLRGFRPGDRLPPVRRLLRQLQISQSTLEGALTELQARGLIARRRGSGIYAAAPRPRGGNAQAIGLYVSDIVDPFCALLAKGVEDELARHGYPTMLFNGFDEFRRKIRSERARREELASAILNLSTANIYAPHCARIALQLQSERGLPLVLTENMLPGCAAPLLCFDNYRAMYITARRVLSGRRADAELVFLGGAGVLPSVARVNGFIDALSSLDRDPAKARLWEALPPFRNTVIPPDLFQAGRPVVCFVAAPLLLPRALAAIQAAGRRVPEDVLVVSVVEENYADAIHVPVVALVKPAVQLGREAARAALRLIRNEPTEPVRKLALKMEAPEPIAGWLGTG